MGVTSSISTNISKKPLKIKKYSNREIETYYNCTLREIKKIIFIKGGDELSIYDNEHNIIKNGFIFYKDKDFKNEDNYIIKEISIFFSCFEKKCEIKLIMDSNPTHTDNVVFYSIPGLTESTEYIIYSSKIEKKFICEFCGLDKIKSVNDLRFRGGVNQQTSKHEKNEKYENLTEIYNKKDEERNLSFIFVYCTNFDTFMQYIKNKYQNKYKNVEYFYLFCFKNQKDRFYINNGALYKFNEFIKENVFDKFKYVDFKKVRLSAFKLKNKAINKNKKLQKFENILGLKIKYYEISLNLPKKKMYKINI
jgi:hypothetical protein